MRTNKKPNPILIFLTSLTLLAPLAFAQESSADAPAVPPTEKLEQLVAPIALYPDSLLTQVLMAATYPLEIVEAARWVAKNPKVTGDALDNALKGQTWDPSVKSLCGLPDVLKRMNDNLDWTQDLGDAFLSDQAALMDTVQNMRRKALEAGNLKTTKEQTVTDQEDKIIVVEATDPEIVYVPTYYPTTVYGAWYYPVYYYPPLYVPPPPGYTMFAFAAGVAWGHAMWGGCHWGWGHTEVNINVNHYNSFVNNTEITGRKNEVQNRGASGQLQHDPQHRKGVRYSDTATAQRFGGGGSNRITQDQARGYGSGTRQPTARPSQPSVSTTKPTDHSGQGSRPQPNTRQPTSRAASARPSTASSAHSGQQSGGFSGSGSPSTTRAASQRGSYSRAGGRAGGRRR